MSALLANRSIPAGELARIAGLSASTTSEHLRVLTDAGIVLAMTEGSRFYRLTNSDVSHAIEALQAIAPRTEIRSLHQHRISEELHQTRTCYDHLALRLGDLLVRQKIIGELQVGRVIRSPKPFPSGPVPTTLGIGPPRGRRPWARGCLRLDRTAPPYRWSSRHPNTQHSAGQRMDHVAVGKQSRPARRTRRTCPP